MQINHHRLNFGVALMWIVGACAVSCTSDDGGAQSDGCGPGTVDCGGV